MKNKLLLVLMSIVAFFTNATDRFYIMDFAISPGETRTVSILLDNEIAYTAFQCDLFLPDGLNVDEESFALTERKNSNHTLTVSAFPERAYRLMSYSLKLKSYSGNSGALVTFEITASDDFTAPAVITLRNTLFTTEEGMEVSFDDEECTITMGLRGDINMDNAVNMDDLTAMINYLLTNNAEGVSLYNANVDLSGDVGMDDLTVLINYLLTNQWPVDPDEPVEPEGTQTITVNGVSFKMVPVESGTFMMGATAEQGDDAYNDEKPVHEVTLSSFYIGQTEVTQALWQAVMGNNPSYFPDDPNRPVEMVSWNDCQAFITQLNLLTGKQFRMPTEAEWEYAARGGNKSQGYKYSGSNDINEVGWYEENSDSISHVVATKAPNELGIYDMTGNVWEWCQDWYARYTAEAQIDPTGPETGTKRVFRGGSWYSSARYSRVTYRDVENMTNSYNRLGLRLVLDDNEVYTVNGVSFTMVPVKGGTFMMGGTEEQGESVRPNELPVHQVTLSSYTIGQTEVTQELWLAVMGSNPSYHTGDLQRPVDKVSWVDCQNFITQLNLLTGETFRLPTEAEWEFAARGGNKSQGFRYAGSDDMGAVAWFIDNCNNTTHPVGTKAPNELGLYDMTGNVWEWCNDWYKLYTADAQVNPTGPETGNNRVLRGGCWNGEYIYNRISYRDNFTPTGSNSSGGLRLVK